MKGIKHFSTLEAYCSGIGISKPKWIDFDVRSFQDNMKTVNHKMPPFKHEFYAIAIKLDGSGFASTGPYHVSSSDATIFFNSPYQILSWDIAPDWRGFYVMFNEEFFRTDSTGTKRTQLSRKRITSQYPFLLNDQTTPLKVSAEEAELFIGLFNNINFEFQLDADHSKEIIAHYLNVLLYKTSRLYKRSTLESAPKQLQRNKDLEIVSRFKTQMELSFQPGKIYSQFNPHQVQFYAEKLNLHPNHFNAVVKRITDKSASEHIYGYVLSLAKTKLRKTSKSVKEIAFELYYSYPNHFTKFFKNHTGKTPSRFRKDNSQI